MKLLAAASFLLAFAAISSSAADVASSGIATQDPSALQGFGRRGLQAANAFACFKAKACAAACRVIYQQAYLPTLDFINQVTKSGKNFSKATCQKTCANVKATAIKTNVQLLGAKCKANQIALHWVQQLKALSNQCPSKIPLCKGA